MQNLASGEAKFCHPFEVLCGFALRQAAHAPVLVFFPRQLAHLLEHIHQRDVAFCLHATAGGVKGGSFKIGAFITQSDRAVALKRAVVGNAQQLFHRPNSLAAGRGGLSHEILDGNGVLAPRGGERR